MSASEKGFYLGVIKGREKILRREGVRAHKFCIQLDCETQGFKLLCFETFLKKKKV
jgi:hypothetical protein